ncbi:hypothetical protein EFT43_04050 [Leuconostoc falkenbergense]|nr:hypothetical protein [Leuconostoc falkenbergense]
MVVLPDNGLRQKRQFDGRRHVSVHGRSIESRLKYVQAQQTFGYFGVETIKTVKKHNELLVTMTGRLGRQQHM